MADEKKTTKAPAQSGGKEKNIGMAVLCYLGILVVVPLLTDAKDDPFVKFHIKQGLVLLIAMVIVNIIWAIPVLGWIIGVFGNIFLLIAVIMGIINAASGKEEKLPLIGQYGDSFNI